MTDDRPLLVAHPSQAEDILRSVGYRPSLELPDGARVWLPGSPGQPVVVVDAVGAHASPYASAHKTAAWWMERP